MSTLTPERIARARQTKQWYLVSLLVMVMSNALVAFANALHVDRSAVGMVVALCSVGALGFSVVMTWRMCRAIGVGIPMTVLTTVLSPISFIIEAIVLLRIYSKRTGVGLTFMMGDKQADRESLAA